MTQIDEFFGANGPDRDRFGRPLLIPEEGPRVKVPYTRASSLGGFLDDQTRIHRWEERHLAKGLGDREDLAAMAAALPQLTGDRETDKPVNLALDDIIRQAKEYSGIHRKANYGTAMHAFTDPTTSGKVPQRMRSDVEAFDAKMAELHAEHLMNEGFCANDQWMAAGTFDYVTSFFGGPPAIADKKTGELAPIDWLVQLATYAWGRPYDWRTDTRYDWPAGFTWDWAWVIWIPRGQGICKVFRLDMALGRQLAMMAANVRDLQRREDLLEEFDAPTPARRADHLSRLILSACSSADLTRLWKANQDIWNDDMTELAKHRKRELAPTFERTP